MSGKKKSVADKKDEAREREETKKKVAKETKLKEADDAYWKSQGEGEKSKAASKRDEEEKKKLEQAAKRAELKRLQDEEDAKLSATKSKLAPAGSQKMTKYQLDKQREIEEALQEEALQKRAQVQKREMDEGSYSRIIDTENVNRAAQGVVDARSVEHALKALTVGEAAPDDKHPEKRMKAAWKAFEERQLAELKQDKPGLKMSQYKDMIWKLWQKSPDNPINQAAVAAAAAASASRA